LHVTVHDCCHAFESFLGVFVQRIKGPLRQFIRTDYQRHSNDLLVYLTFHIIGTQRILFCELASLKSGKICQTDITSNKTSQSYSDTWLVWNTFSAYKSHVTLELSLALRMQIKTSENT